MDASLTRHYEAAGREEAGGSTPAAASGTRGRGSCSRCLAVLSEAGALRVEERRVWMNEIVAKVVERLIELAPDLLERVLAESGALEADTRDK